MPDGLSGYSLGELLARDRLVRRQRATAPDDRGVPREYVITRCEAPPSAPLGGVEAAAEAARALPEESVIPIHALGRDVSGQPFVVCKPVAGRRLDERLAEGPLEPREALWIALDLARTLAAAHALQPPLVHGAIRTSAILIDEKGHARLDDYAFGHAMGQVAQADGAILEATARFHSPEHVGGGALPTGSDLFALASVLFEAVTRRPAFEAGSAVDVLLRISMGKVPPGDPTISPDLHAILSSCWAKHPGKRPPASALVARLEELTGPDDPRLPAAPAPPTPAPMTIEEEAYDPLDAPTLLQTELPNHIPEGVVLPMARRAPTPEPRSRESSPTAPHFMPAEVVGMPDDVPTMRGESMAVAEILARSEAPVPPRGAPPAPLAPALEATAIGSPPASPTALWILVGIGALLALLLFTILVVLLAS